MKTTSCGGNHIGFEGAKGIKGCKRFILVDRLGLILFVQAGGMGKTRGYGFMKILQKDKTLSRPAEPDAIGLGRRGIPQGRFIELCQKVMGLGWAGGFAKTEAKGL